MAGAAAAAELSLAGARVHVFDKGRATGGRLATRVAAIGPFDHGAQFLSASRRPFSYRLDRHPDVGSVASKMLLFERRDHIHTTGDVFTVDGRAGNRGVWQRDVGQYAHEEYVFSACGGSAAYRRAMLDAIGVLDDDFFFSGEDVDLGWRAQLAGWRCLYTPHAIVYHHLSASGGGVTASYHDGRNLIYLLVKNVPSALWRKYGWQIGMTQARLAWEAIRAWRGKAARARLRGMIAGVRGIPRMIRKRRAIQAARRVSDAYIESILSPGA